VEEYLIGAPAFVRPEHDDIGSLVVQGIGRRHRPLAQQLDVGATALQGLLHLHLVLEDESLVGEGLGLGKERGEAVVLHALLQEQRGLLLFEGGGEEEGV